MKLKDLTERFAEENRYAYGKKMEGYITFSQKSFNTPYPIASRTYIISSNNKMFKPWGLGEALFGSSLDKSDIGVRLDLYMQPHEGHLGWQVEDCGLVVYELIATFERKTSVLGVFSSHEEAYHAMLDSFTQTVNAKNGVHAYLSENEGELSPDSAWVNDAGPEGGNCDWKIVSFLNNGFTLTPVQHLLSTSEEETHTLQWKELKEKLLETTKRGNSDILSFLGSETPVPNDMYELGRVLDEAEQQMPEDVFQRYYLQYCFFEKGGLS